MQHNGKYSLKNAIVKMGTRKNSVDFWGVGRELVTLKNKNSYQNNI